MTFVHAKLRSSVSNNMQRAIFRTLIADSFLTMHLPWRRSLRGTLRDSFILRRLHPATTAYSCNDEYLIPPVPGNQNPHAKACVKQAHSKHPILAKASSQKHNTSNVTLTRITEDQLFAAQPHCCFHNCSQIVLLFHVVLAHVI